MAGPRDFQTEWSKRKIEYDIAYIWNITKGYKWTYLQNRSRVTDIENKLMVTSEKTGIDTYILLYVKY